MSNIGMIIEERARDIGVGVLDQTMPELDGYQVLEAIKAEGLNAMVIVISGDIQPNAQARVTQLGAMDFIQKPVNPEKLAETLRKFGLI